MERADSINYPKVLVISNNSFSKSSSNGRTLGNFFYGWPKERLAQFCLTTSGPDFNLCDNYYCISDKSVLKAFVSFKSPQRTLFDKQENKNTPSSYRVHPKTPLRMLIRNAIWSFCKWKSSSFFQWINDFSPEIILLMNSDSFFIINIARYIARIKKLPLLLVNMEGFYFFSKNYMWKGKCDFMAFPIYQGLYRHYFKKLMTETTYTIYGNSLLKEDYDIEFHGRGRVIYTGASIDYHMKNSLESPPSFSYLGNFGFRRYDALIELSEILHEINPTYRLNVYGDASSDVIKILNSAPYIDFKGLVPYDEVISIMHKSDILFHVENQSEDFQMSLKYGFSTKIADSIASGTLFCLYASPGIACSKYIMETQAAIYSCERDDLKNKIISVLNDNKLRLDFIKRGHFLADLNHNLKKNAEVFRVVVADAAWG